jgi:integrase
VAKHGTPTLKTCNGCIGIRLPKHVSIPQPYHGKILFGGFQDNPSGRLKAEELRLRIHRDILGECFNWDAYQPSHCLEADNVQMSISVLCERFLREKEQNVAKRTAIIYRNAAKQFCKMYGERHPDTVTAKDVTKYVNKRSETLSTEELRRQIEYIRVVYKWGAEKGACTTDPFTKVLGSLKKTEANIPKPFSNHEISAILKGFEISTQRRCYIPMLQFLLGTGLRPGEVRALKWTDITSDCKSILVIDSVDGQNKSKGRTKTARSRRKLQLSKSMIELLLSLPKISVYVFPAKESNGILNWNNWTKRIWKPVLIEALGENLYRGPYHLRHTAITRWIDQGVPINRVVAMAGTSIECLQRNYMGVLDDLTIPEMPS